MIDRRPTLATAEHRRLFTLHDGHCHICERPIDGVHERWEIEHVIPRGLIGKAADTDGNMRPAHVRCHKAKTVQDADDIARAKRRHDRHTGAFRPRATMSGSRDSGWKHRMDGRWERRGAQTRAEA